MLVGFFLLVLLTGQIPQREVGQHKVRVEVQGPGQGQSGLGQVSSAPTSVAGTAAPGSPSAATLVSNWTHTDSFHFESSAAREAELKSARLARERVELLPFEIESQRARVRTGEAERAHAVAEVERQRGLSTQGFLTGQEFRDAELRARVSADALASARAELARLERSLDLERRSADNAVKRAEELVAQARIAAPIEGEVLKVSVRPGERSGGQPLVHLGETREMMAVAEVHANDIRFVRVGQRALFTSAALADGVEGVVDAVGAAIYDNRIFGEDPSAPRGLRVFEVRVKLADSSRVARFTNLEGQVRLFVGE